MSALEATPAWRHWCGYLNEGPDPLDTGRTTFCGGCRTEVEPNRAVRRDETSPEVVRYWLVERPGWAGPVGVLDPHASERCPVMFAGLRELRCDLPAGHDGPHRRWTREVDA